MKLNILFLILIEISYEYIVIPFNSSLSNIEDNLSPTQFAKKMLNNFMTTNIKIGTPNQNLNFFIDFHSYHSYILDLNLTNANIINKDKYDKNKSSSYLQYNKENETIFFQKCSFERGYNSSDIFQLTEESKKFPLHFILVTDPNFHTNINFTGSIGLGILDNGTPKFQKNNILHLLKRNNIIDRYILILKFNKKNNNGNIIIGKNIYEQYPNDSFRFAHAKIQSVFNAIWSWNYFNVYYNGKYLDIASVYLRPEIGVAIMAYNYRTKLFNIFFELKIREGKCFEECFDNNYYFFYCNEDVSLEFIHFDFKRSNGNITFTLDYNDLTKVYNGKRYLLILFNKLISTTSFFVGLPLLKKYDFMFQQDTKIMGFYNFKIDSEDDIKKNNLKKIYPLILAFIFIYFGVYFYINLKRKKGKNQEKCEYEEMREI